MATQPYTLDSNETLSFAARSIYRWTLAGTDDGSPLELPEGGGLAGAIQASGTFGGGAVALELSNDGVSWFTAKDPNGTSVTGTSGYLMDFSTAAKFLRPRATSSVTSVTITLVLRK